MILNKALSALIESKRIKNLFVLMVRELTYSNTPLHGRWSGFPLFNVKLKGGTGMPRPRYQDAL